MAIETENYTLDQEDLIVSSEIAEDWGDKYELKLDLSVESEDNNWIIEFYSPYEISEAYKVDLVDKGDGNYVIEGQDDPIEPTLIIQSNGQEAVIPEFTLVDTDVEWEETEPQAESENENSDVSDVDEEWQETDSEDSDAADEEEIESEAESENENSNVSDAEDGEEANSEDSDPFDDETMDEEDENTSESTDNEVIDVDNDFGGDIDSAIAAADNGDVVQLGNDTYYTSGITIDKDITLDGEEDSVIDGSGTSDSILNLTSGASGATLKDLTITNGNNGIYADGAFDLTLQNLSINNIGLSQTIRNDQNNTGISLNYANNFQLLDSQVSNVGRKGVGINDTEGGTISGLTLEDINLEALHSQQHDAAGIKLFNTNNVTVKDNQLSQINANNIWNDTTNGTTITGNVIENVGDVFLTPDFINEVDISGIYNEKSANSYVANNTATSVGEFAAFNATSFTTETMTLEANNSFSSEVNTSDFWINESAEKQVATTANPDEANFGLFAEEYFAQINIG